MPFRSHHAWFHPRQPVSWNPCNLSLKIKKLPVDNQQQQKVIFTLPPQKVSLTHRTKLRIPGVKCLFLMASIRSFIRYYFQLICSRLDFFLFYKNLNFDFDIFLSLWITMTLPPSFSSYFMHAGCTKKEARDITSQMWLLFILLIKIIYSKRSDSFPNSIY